MFSKVTTAALVGYASAITIEQVPEQFTIDKHLELDNLAYAMQTTVELGAHCFQDGPSTIVESPMCQFMVSEGFNGMREVISEALADDDCQHCDQVGLYPVNEAEIAGDVWQQYIATRNLFHTVSRAIDHSLSCYTS